MARIDRIATMLAMACLACCAWSGVAAAQDRPLYLPNRDVTITYRLISEQAGAGAAREAHFSYSAALDKLRLDRPPQPGYAVIDRGTKRMFLVMADQRSYVELPFDSAMASGFILNDQMQFTRAGSDTVAGLACTKWTVVSKRASGTVCVTADGVMLSGQGRSHDGAVSGIEATSVTYAAQPAALFVPPPDFKQIRMPAPPPK